VLLVGDGLSNDEEVLAVCCDELLSRLNCEYRSKRNSGRLGPIEVVSVSMKEFVAQHHTWETQFKFLPLIRESTDPVLI
jgi:hypothetical protein